MIFDQEFFESIVNTLPSPLFVVDADVCIQFANYAGDIMINQPAEKYHLRRGGDILQCIYSKVNPEGCGHAEECGSCVIRNSVKESMNGSIVTRKRHKMRLINDDVRKDAYLLVTTAPFKYNNQDCAVLLLEDISEIAAIQGLISICSHCKRVRDKNDKWVSVETYFEKETDVDFSHSICDSCFKEIYQKQINEMSEKKERKNEKIFGSF